MSPIPSETSSFERVVLSTVNSRVPLLLPAAGWLAGLLLIRTDIVDIPTAVTLTFAGLVLGFWRFFRVFAIFLFVALVWGGVSLMWDAHRLLVDPSWLVGSQRFTAEITDVRIYPTHHLLRLDQVQRADGARLTASVQMALYGKTPFLAPGMRIAGIGKFHAPRNALNPGAFNYRTYCFDRGLALVGSLRGKIRVLSDHASWLQRLRRCISSALMPLPDVGQGVLRALLLGDRSRIPVTVRDDFAATGTAHLLAISGLHVGMVAGWTFFLIWWLLTRREAWIVKIPVRRVAMACGVIAAGFYATLAGWPLPTQRAAMMLAAATIAWLLRRHAEPLNTLLAALILITAIEPAAIASVSLWLSFAATTGILLGLSERERGHFSPLKWIAAMLAVTIVASLATMPIIVGFFGRLSLYSVLANLMAVPLFTAAILPLALIGEVLALLGANALAEPAFSGAVVMINFCEHWLASMHAWPWGNLWVPDPSSFSAGLYVAGVILALWLVYSGRKWMAVATLSMTLLVWGVWVTTEHSPGHTEWVVWDVGQGAASSLITPGGHDLVMDVPGSTSSSFNGGSKVAAGLRSMGMVHVDVLAISHAQADHMGGANRLIDQERHIGALWLADVPENHARADIGRLVDRVKAEGGVVRWLARGDQLNFYGWHIHVLWPPRGIKPSNHNNASLVLSVEGRGLDRSLLWPGDAEVEAEREMLKWGVKPHWGMLMPHHGSLSSSSESFLEALHPFLAIAQTGLHNRYGFPKHSVVRRYQAMGTKILNTANGAVFVRWPDDGGHAEVQQFHQNAPGRRDRALQWWQRSL